MEQTSASTNRNQGSPRRRNPSRRLIQIAIAISTIATATLVSGFGFGTYTALGGNGTTHHSPTPIASPATSTGSTANSSKLIHLVAIGDSLAHGLGDASDKGFIGDVSQQYRNNGYTTIQSNLGVDGQTSQGLRSEIHQPSIQTLIRSANVILISIGGNDLNDAAGLPKINTQKIAATQAVFSTNLTDILTTIRKENPQSPVLLVGLYNPYANIAYDRAVTDSMVQSWDAKAEGIVEKFPNTVMVQTFDLFELHDNQLLYVDHFHPNQMGYQLIANRIWQDIKGVSTQ